MSDGMIRELTFIAQIFLSVLLGALIGFERERVKKPAGVRTYILVSLGSCLISIISSYSGTLFSEFAVDPTRIASQLLTGIGFIGAGVIMKKGDHVEGITTAAGLLVACGIGMAIGFGMYIIGIATTLITWLILLSLHILKHEQ